MQTKRDNLIMETNMCTMIVEKVKVDGSGKGTSGWFKLEQANVSYDHPFNAPLEHALLRGNHYLGW